MSDHYEQKIGDQRDTIEELESTIRSQTKLIDRLTQKMVEGRNTDTRTDKEAEKGKSPLTVEQVVAKYPEQVLAMMEELRTELDKARELLRNARDLNGIPRAETPEFWGMVDELLKWSERR